MIVSDPLHIFLPFSKQYRSDMLFNFSILCSRNTEKFISNRLSVSSGSYDYVAQKTHSQTIQTTRRYLACTKAFPCLHTKSWERSGQSGYVIRHGLGMQLHLYTVCTYPCHTIHHIIMTQCTTSVVPRLFSFYMHYSYLCNICWRGEAW